VPKAENILVDENYVLRRIMANGQWVPRPNLIPSGSPPTGRWQGCGGETVNALATAAALAKEKEAEFFTGDPEFKVRAKQIKINRLKGLSSPRHWSYC
jgi:hypothetical protein